MNSGGWVTHTLAFNGYCFGAGEAWLSAVNREFSAERLDALLARLVTLLEAVIIERSGTQYEPVGASAAMLIGQSAFAHLAESHVAIHTYPDHFESASLSVLRVECEVSSCGGVHPNVCLPELLNVIRPELVTIDRRTRGLVASGTSLHPARAPKPGLPPVGFVAHDQAGSLQILTREGLSEPHATTVRTIAGQFMEH